MDPDDPQRDFMLQARSRRISRRISRRGPLRVSASANISAMIHHCMRADPHLGEYLGESRADPPLGVRAYLQVHGRPLQAIPPLRGAATS